MNVSKNYNDNSAIPNVSSAIDISPLNYYNTAKFDTPSSGSLLKDRILSLKDTGSRLVSDGHIAEGLECYTAMFNILSTMQDSTGVEFNKYFTENVEELNKIAMKYVQHNDTETGHKILTFCDEVTQPVKYGNFPLQRTQTLNNIGCLYRRVGKLKGALNYLRSALMILNKNDMMEHSAVTYLNLSAIQAQMGDRQQAYQNARNALVYAQEEIVLYEDNYDREKYKEKVVTLAIVYHNMGAEEEHLQNLKNALDYYEKAFAVMDEYGIFDEKLYHKFKSEHAAAQERFGSMDKFATKRVVSPMGLPGVSPTTQRPHRQLFETLSSKVSPRGIVMFGPTKQTVAPNVEIHHRASSQKTFQFKDKRIVSQPRYDRPPMISTTTPSGPNGWSNTIKPSTSVKSVHPRPLHRDRFSAYKRDEDGTQLTSKRRLNKSRSRDTVESKNNVMSDKEESNIDSDNSQVYYKVPVPVSAAAVMTTTVKKPQNDAKFFGKNPASSPTKETRIKTQDEIKALEDMGVLDWSDQSVDTKRKKEEKQTIKKNQKKFFSGLKNASVTNFNGNFKLMDDSSESSASSSGTSSPSQSKSKTKISRKSNKEQVQQESQSALKNSKGFVEDIIDDPDQVSEVIEDLNSSKASRVTSKAGDVSKRQDKSVTNKSEVKMFRDSKVIVSPIKQKDQAQSSANVRPSKIERGSKYDMMLSWGEFSGLQSKAVVEPEEESSVPTPREVLTKEQMRALYKAQVKAAMFIQKLFRARELKERAKLILESKRMKANKTLIRKKWVIMRAKKTVGKTIVEREEQDYNLNIFAMPEREALLLVLTEGRTRLRYDAEESYAHLELDKAQPVTHAYNNGLLQQLCDDLIERMYIMDHLLLFKEKKASKEKDAKDKEYSYLDLEEESEIGTRGAPINFKEHEAKIVKIQSRFRGNQTRQKLQEQKDLNSRNFKFLYKEMVKIDEHLVRLRIIQYIATQKIFITGVDMTSKNKFNNLEVPAKFMEGFGRKQDDATNKLEFDFDTFEISLLPSVEAELYPEKKKKAIRKIDIVSIVRIQSLVRRYMVRKMFKLKLKKSRESPGMKLLKKYVTNVNRCLFIVRIHHNKEVKQEPNQESQERNQFIVTAKSSDYHANIPPLTIPLEEVDKTEFCDNTTNVKRLVDILVPYIKIDFTKAETFVLVFNKREYDRSTRRFESQLMNFNIFESASGEQHEEEKTEVQKKIWNFLQEKNFLETNKHIIKNFLGLQTAVATVKISEENETRIQNFGSIEDGAARQIQKFYRKILMTRYFNTIAEKDRMSGSKISASQILSNSVRSKSYSLFCEAYKRMMMSEDELHRQSTNEYSFVKSVSNIKFINTKLEAKAHVFFNKTNPKDKTIDIEIFMPLIGLHQYEKIPESDVFQNSIKPSSFQKKVEEHLISKLEYNPITKKVKFMKDGIKASEADMMDHAKQTLSTFIHAKLIRLKYLRRKIMTKNMVPIGVHTSEVDRLFVSMSSFWHPHQKQLRILLERIDDLVHHKDIIVKFDIQQSNKELRKLIDSPNADPKELCEKLKPYADYISKHIILQPDAKSGSGSKKDFKMMMDGTVFKIEFVNSRFVVASIKDISEDTLKDILAKGKTSVKASKLLDVKQLESLFPKNIDLKDILNNDRKDNEDQDAVELLRKSERLDSKDEDQMTKSTKKRLDKTKALVIIQKMVRGNADRQKYETMRARKLAEQMKKQSFGVRVKKMSKKIEENYWTITAYMKVLDANARMYYFFASNLTDSETPDKVQARGIFRADNMLILNSDGRELVDALLDRIEIIGQSIEFNLERDNFVKFGTPEEQGKGVVMREVKLDTEAFNAETRRGQQEEKVKGGESARMTELENENDSPMSSRRLTTVRDEQPTEPVIGSEHEYMKKKSSKATKGGEEEEKKVKKDPLPENLLNQKTEAQSNNLLLYNVYYNNDETQLKPAPNPLLTESKKDPRHRTRKQSISLATDNVVKISVDLKELRKYNPNLDPKSPADLKMIANELANSIQVNEKGHILINDSKVNPNALKLLEKQLDVVENPVKDIDQDAKYSQKKKILFKMTKAYGDRKYLLLINYLEKPSNLNNILSIVRKEDDQVYEEFELFIEVNVVCLSNNAIRPITWELSLKEGQSLSGLVNATEVAKFFAANIHLFGDQILLSTPFQPSVNYKNVMIMNENAIKMIQNRFRTKKFAKNFTRFRNNLIVNRTSIIARAVIAINNVSYHVLGYENSKDQDLQVEVWSLINYERSMVSVSKKLVERLYAMDKKKAFNSIFKFLRFELNKKKEYELVLKEKTMFDYLKLNGEV